VLLYGTGKSTTHLERHTRAHTKVTDFLKNKEKVVNDVPQEVLIARAFAENCLPLSLLDNSAFRLAFNLCIPHGLNRKTLRRITLELAELKRQRQRRRWTTR
jgi:hypothetical protein